MKSFMLSVFPRPFPRSTNFPILSNSDKRQKCLVSCCALLVILLTEKSMSSAIPGTRLGYQVENRPGYFGENLNNAISYSPYAFGVTVYGNNDNIKKRHDSKNIQIQKG